MKGIVFAELLEMVEANMGLDVADRMIDGATTSTGGAYSSVGTYDHAELLSLVGSLSRETSTPGGQLVRVFGQHLFARLHELYPDFFVGVHSALDFLPMVEDIIHVEVRKLYPDAELPTFVCQTVDGVFVMTYRSNRPFADLAEGMIMACIAHFGDALELDRQDLGECDGTYASFRLPSVGSTHSARTAQECQK